MANSHQFTSPEIIAQNQCGSRRLKTSSFFLSGSSSYERLSNELSRYVKCITSIHNPTSHLPTDEELQHQARWIVYDEYATFFLSLSFLFSPFFISSDFAPNNLKFGSTFHSKALMNSLLIFGSGDPWNQTPADNPEWLLQFKESVGLIDPAANTVECTNGDIWEEVSICELVSYYVRSKHNHQKVHKYWAYCIKPSLVHLRNLDLDASRQAA